MHGERLHQARCVRARRALLDVGEEARELHEEDERHEHADEREPLVVEHVVGEARRAERARDHREQQHRVLLGEPEAHEAVRRVVAAALRDGTAFEEAHDRHERRVEDRHREDEDREQQRRHRRSGDLPARGEPERGQREAEHLRARVAHEDERLAAGAQVVGQEAGARERACEREGEHRVARVDRHCVDREEDERDPRERRREPVHVVEQVERVSHPDEPEQREPPADHVAVDQLHVRAGREDDDRRRELQAELRERRQRADVVDEPGDEEDRDPAEDAGDLLRQRHGAGRDRRPEAGGDPGVDPDAAEERSGAVVPALGGRRGDQPGRERRAQERPHHESGRGEGDDSHGGAHVCRG